MSFPPNNYQSGNSFFSIPTNQQQQGNNTTTPINLNQSQTGSDGVSSNANWFNQQSWQQQHYQQHQQQVNPQQPSFFDTIPNQVNQQLHHQSQLHQPNPINNNAEIQHNVEGWGDWDDWNQNDTKLNNRTNLVQSQNCEADNMQRNNNWQWQNNPSSNNQQQWNLHQQPKINWQNVQDHNPVSTTQTTQFDPVSASPAPLTPHTHTISTNASDMKQVSGQFKPPPPETGGAQVSHFINEPSVTKSNKPETIGASQMTTSMPTPFNSAPSTSVDPITDAGQHPLINTTPPISNWQNNQLFKRSGPLQRTSIKMPSTSAVPLMVPSTIQPLNENQDLNVPDNFEVFENNGKSAQISLPNSSLNIEESLPFVPPVPQMFENRLDESVFKVPEKPHEQQAFHPIPTSVASPPRQKINIAEVAVIKPPTNNEVPAPRPQINMEIPVSLPPSHNSLNDREMFLNQENIANERDRFINQSDLSDNLLPPPVAYQQPTPNDDRNQYLQTSHLSEDDFVLLNNPSNDDDVNLPPPGLSRYVLGEPEPTGDNERLADGEDNDAIQPPPISISSDSNRNMYSFAGPIDQVQRVVTGLESMTISQPINVSHPQQTESRDVDLDGENIEDQQQVVPRQHREEPTIGGDPSSNEPDLNTAASSNMTDAKNISNSSTGNDSDHHNRNSNKKYSSRGGKSRKSYDIDDSEGSSERDRARHKEKERKRRDHEKESDDEDSYRQKSIKAREEKHRHNSGRYDDSRYETEESTRYERSGKRNQKIDRDRKYHEDIKRGGNHRRSYREERPNRRVEGERERRENRERTDREDTRDRRRRTTDHKHRTYDDNYQQYSRKNTSSRSARDSDYEKDPRYNLYNMYSGYEYDPYAYYHQQQQYFEQLRRTNPQSYAEWYRKYYSQMQGDSLGGTDCRESVHSGRSSAAGHVNEKDRPENMTNLEGRSVAQDDLQETGRLTPYKYSNDHAVLSLVSGILVCVKPKYSHSNGLQNIVKLINISPNDSTKKLFQAFPGPLVKGITHKKTVIEYCEDRIKYGPRLRSCHSSLNSLQSLSGSQQSNHCSSYVLLWNLLILLLRQNGVVVGTDIAELLVKNEKLFPYETQSKRNSINSIENDAQESNENEIENSDLDKNEEKIQLNDEEITDKFRNYLLYGNVKDALEWATDNNLWGHALFLASKVDRRLHANVMMKFANKLQLNDPLQTLYQLMSGRCPSSVTNVQDEKWGDWRPHLAMIISNTTQSPDLNRKAITSLGDSLLNRGDLFAAQFSYLMAQVGFGKYSSVTDGVTSANMIRLVLLGSSHIKTNSFLEFASNDAIIMTEIYEYACSLNDERFSIVEFQPYKFLLACRLLDYGFHLKALMYLEQIFVHIQKDPSRYEAPFIEKVYELADRLKFYDPVLEKTFGDENEGQCEDQEWLKNLRALCEQTMLSTGVNYTQEYQQSYDYNNYESNLPTIPESGSVQQVQEIVQPDNHFQSNYYQQDPTLRNNEMLQGTDSYANFYQPPQQQQEIPSQDDLQHHQQQQQQQHPPFSQPQQEPYQPNYGSYDYYNQNYSAETTHQLEQSGAAIPSISMPNSGSGPKRSIFDDDGSQQSKIGGGQSEIKKEEVKKNTQQLSKQGPSSQNSGWFGGIFNKLSGKPKNQMILPDDKNPTIVWDAEKKKWINTDEGEESQESFAPPPKMADIPHRQSHQQQQQLLQQQQQQHVQQPQQMQPRPQSATMPSSVNADPMAPISTADPQVQTHVKSSGLQSNMFKIQRNRTLKKSYVDVFNPSGASTKPSESIMAPSLPPLPNSGFMVPAAAADSASQQSQGTAQFYDPNAYSGNFNQ